MKSRSTLRSALSLGLLGLAAAGAARAEPLRCGAPASPAAEGYVARNLERADLQKILDDWQRREGIALIGPVRAMLAAEYLCEEYRQGQRRKGATDEDIRAAGGDVLRSYLRAQQSDTPKADTLNGFFAQHFGDPALFFPKVRQFIALTVLTQPAAAEVAVDGLGLGAAKKAFVTPGRHAVTASLQGFRGCRQEVEVTTANVVLHLALLHAKP